MFKKLAVVLCSVFVLFGCQSVANQKVDQQTFEKSAFVSEDKNSAVQRVFFQGDKLIVSVDLTKEKDQEAAIKIVKYSQGAENMALDKVENKAVYEADLSKKVAKRFYKAGVPDYDSQYGKNYVVFYNPTIVAPSANQSAWAIKMDWSKQADTAYIGLEEVFLFTVNDKNQLVSQVNQVFTREK